MSKLQLGKIAVDTYDMHEAIFKIVELIQSGKGGNVFTPNVDHVILAESNTDFADAYTRADVSLADGMPIVWASKVIGPNIPERVSGSDLLVPLLSLCEFAGFTVFFLGSSEGTAKKAVKKAIDKFPFLSVVGNLSPKVSANPSDEEVKEIMAQVMQDKPDVIIVALGAPKQELFMDKAIAYRGSSVMLGLGASLDFLAGDIMRAPKALQKAGMEWFWRLCQEPKRLGGRYLRDFKFPFVVAKQYFKDQD